MVLEVEVEPGSPFDGRLVRELGLPPGCILIRCREGSREWVPMAATRLEGHNRITVVISPEAKGGAAAVRHGCEAEAD